MEGQLRPPRGATSFSHITGLIASLAAHDPATSPAYAQAADWPNHPLTLVVPFSAGGSSDIIGRILAARLPAGQCRDRHRRYARSLPKRDTGRTGSDRRPGGLSMRDPARGAAANTGQEREANCNPHQEPLASHTKPTFRA